MSIQQIVTLQGALEIIESLPEYQQEDIIDIIRHKLIDHRRELLAKKHPRSKRGICPRRSKKR